MSKFLVLSSFWSWLLVLVCALPALGETPPRDVSALLKGVQEKNDVPGMVGAILEGSQVTALGASGVRKRGHPAPITSADLMHLGSCTKAMTATLAARFVEKGKIQWTTKISDVFPGLKMQPAWKDVTLELLLTNRSGAPTELNADKLWDRLSNHTGTPTEQRQALLEGVVSREPAAPPGTKFIYSNAGFAIAGHMLEQIAREPWEHLMERELFQPLGITTAGFGAPGAKGKLDQPLGHRGDEPVELGRGSDNPAAIGPAGTVHMAIRDWAKFIALHLHGDPHFLGAESFAKLHAVPSGAEVPYAMGWSVTERPWADGPVLTHNGSNKMWYCVAWLAPKKDFAILVCCNQGGDKAAKACDEAASALIQERSKYLP